MGRFGVMIFPLRGGDEISVEITGGNFKSPGVSIIAVKSNQTAKVPTDWNNDRVLFDLNVPFEVRAPAIRMTSTRLWITITGRRT